MNDYQFRMLLFVLGSMHATLVISGIILVMIWLKLN